MSEILKVANLKKYYGNKNKAVDGIDFEICNGEIVGLIGPNGAGKTTTIKCILGLLRKTEGQVAICGLDIKDEEAKYKIAYIPETPELYPLLTVWEHLKFIAFGYRLKNWELKAEDLLKRFDLYEKKDELTKGLSKGMKQKLSICCSLLYDAELFLIDEPLIGLDPKAIRELKDIFLELKSQGKGLLISTHILDAIEKLCGRVLVMKKGKIICSGKLEELRANFKLDEKQSLEDIFLEVTENNDEYIG